MGIVERIKQIQTEQAQKAAEREAARKAQEQESKTYWENFYKFLDSQEQKLLKETRISEILQKIERNFLEKQENHKIFQERSYAVVNLQLAWNYQTSQLGENCINGNEFNSIDVQIRLDNELITINGKELPSENWQKDRDLIEMALAEAFLTPNKNLKPQPGWADPGYGGGLGA